MNHLPILDGVIVSDPAPLSVSGFNWRTETRGTVTGYFALVRGWRLSVFVNEHNCYHCQVENLDLDCYNFLFARQWEAAPLLARILKEHECNTDDCLRRALEILKSDTCTLYKYWAITDIAYEIVNGYATENSRRALTIVLDVTNKKLLVEGWE